MVVWLVDDKGGLDACGFDGKSSGYDGFGSGVLGNQCIRGYPLEMVGLSRVGLGKNGLVWKIHGGPDLAW